MNIRDLWPQGTPLPNDPYTWQGLLKRREQTAICFLTIQQEKSLLRYPMRFDQPDGQDALRLLFFHTLEEIAESIDAEKEEHVLEELIDAVFFLLEIPLLDEWKSIPLKVLADKLHTEASFTGLFLGPHRIGMLPELGGMAYRFGIFCDRLRNRSWMHHAQDVYFDGAEDLLRVITDGMSVLLSRFSSWESFWQYYIAKDEVLKFRIKSQY